MADNYLEKKMEEYRSGKLGQARRKVARASTAPRDPLTGLRIFVTGGASGIGRAIVGEFRAHDCKVAFVDIDRKGGAETAQQSGALFIPCDVADSQALEKALQTVSNRWGDIDVVVNNAGIGAFKPLSSLTLSDFDRVLDINLRPIIVTSHFILESRLKATDSNSYGGRIINICSTRHSMSEAGTEAYTASKGAIASLTHALMMSLSPVGVTVNAVSPGWIENGDYDALRDIDHSQHPSGRVGRPDDIARYCAFLADPRNDFINGTNLAIDGGMTRKMIYEPDAQ